MSEGHLPEHREDADPSDWATVEVTETVTINITNTSLGRSFVNDFLRLTLREEIFPVGNSSSGPRGHVASYRKDEAEPLMAWLRDRGVLPPRSLTDK